MPSIPNREGTTVQIPIPVIKKSSVGRWIDRQMTDRQADRGCWMADRWVCRKVDR